MLSCNAHREYVIDADDQYDYYFPTVTASSLSCIHYHANNTIRQCFLENSTYVGVSTWHDTEVAMFDSWWVIHNVQEPYTAMVSIETGNLFGWAAGGVEYIYWNWEALDTITEETWTRPTGVFCIPV